MRIKTILAPIDFSERATAAAEHAKAMAERFDAKLLFAHIVPPSPYEYAAFDEGFYAATNWPTLEAVRGPVTRRLEELGKKIGVSSEVENLVRRGDPAAEIAAIVKERNVDLVVVPTHGYGAFRRFMLGSVTTKVLHDVDVPVLTGAHVPEIAPVDTEPYKRVACAIDLHEHSEETLRWAAELSKACADDLIVIHAAPQIEVGGTYGDWFPPETREQVLAHARASVDALLDKTGCVAQVVVGCSEPVSFIRQAAEENYADLLVIGRGLREGFLPGLRAHAYAIIRDAPCPVISV